MRQFGFAVKSIFNNGSLFFLDNESAFYGGFKFSTEYCEHIIQY